MIFSIYRNYQNGSEKYGDGDIAGIVIFQKPNAYIGSRKTNWRNAPGGGSKKRENSWNKRIEASTFYFMG